jgi:hypothetical protein
MDQYDNMAPPVDEDGMPVFLTEADLIDQSCPHAETREVGHGMALGRFSNGNERVTEECVDCGTVVSQYMTGGVL